MPIVAFRLAPAAVRGGAFVGAGPVSLGRPAPARAASVFYGVGRFSTETGDCRLALFSDKVRAAAWV